MYVTFSISVFNCGLSIFNKRILLLSHMCLNYGVSVRALAKRFVSVYQPWTQGAQSK